MIPKTLHYDLHNGFIQNWLTAGPQEILIQNLESYTDNTPNIQVARGFYNEDSGITAQPVERGPLTEGLFSVGDYQGSWSYTCCQEDHLVDHSGYYPRGHFLRSWVYAQLHSKKEQQVTLVLTSFGPVDFWVNGVHILREEQFSLSQPRSIPFIVSLNQHANEILLRFENIAERNCAHAVALRVCRAEKKLPANPNIPGALEPAAGVEVRLPSLIPAISRRIKLERLFEKMHLKRDIYARDEKILLFWTDDIEKEAYNVVRFQTSTGTIYAEANLEKITGEHLFLHYPYQVSEGSYNVILMPSQWEYYEKDIRYTKTLELWVMGNHAFSESPYGNHEQRRREGLEDAAKREYDLFAEIAKMALGKWPAVDPKIILQAVNRVNQRADESNLDLLGILGMLIRFGGESQFPRELKKAIKKCILDYRFWLDEPGRDEMDFTSEAQRILFHTCEILAGQVYNNQTFSNSGMTGEEHRKKGERLALAWLHERGSYGFGDCDSDTTFALEIVALSHLIDLARSEQIWDLASVVLDKLFYTIALNSFKGVLGSTRFHTRSLSIKGGLEEATSGIIRLMWGQGIFNHHLAGTVSVACMDKYELPPTIAEIAAALPEELWNRERRSVVTDPISEKGGREVNKVTYKTPDAMLCSAQDYYLGEKGRGEHIWQATIGPEAVVFVNHPVCSSWDDARTPNFWLGNAVLPRVAQWKDALIAIHNLPEDDWMEFTHAYFPTEAFDEFVLQKDWAFARKGNAYLALTCSQGFTLVQEGFHACRELRSYGKYNIWLCHLGRAAVDGDFATFQEKIARLEVVFEDLSVTFPTLRGGFLSFGWQGPLLLDGAEMPLAGFRHYENPSCVAEYPCQQMEIIQGEYLLRLNFSSPPSPEG